MATPCRFIVQEDASRYYCVLCDRYEHSYVNAEHHARGQSHYEALDECGRDITLSSDCNYYCNLCYCTIPGYENVYRHLHGRRHYENMWDDVDDYYYDDLPHFVSLFVSEETYEEYYCALCDRDIFGYKQYVDHIKSQNHIFAVENYGCDIKSLGAEYGDLYNCLSCNCTISGYTNIYEHIWGKRHQSILEYNEKNKQELLMTENLKREKENSEKLRREMENQKKLRIDKENAEKLRIDKENAEKLRRDMENAEKLKRAMENQEKLKKPRDDAEKLKLQEEKRKADKWAMEKKMAETWEREKLEAEKWKAEKEKAERWEREKLEAEKWKVEKEKAQKWEREKLEAEKWKAEKIKAEQWEREKREAEMEKAIKLKIEKEVEKAIKLEIEKLEAKQLRAEKEKAEKLHIENGRVRAENLITEKLRSTEIKCEEQITESKNIPENSQTLKIDSEIRDIENFESQCSNATHFPAENGSRKTSEHSESMEKSSIEEPEKSTNFSKVATVPMRNETFRSSFKIKTRVRKAMREKFVDYLDFEDEIYDGNKKIRDATTGLETSLPVNGGSIYCLVCRETIVDEAENYFDHLRDLDHFDCLEGMEKDDDLFDLLPEQFSDLSLARNYMEEDSDDLIKCLICEKNLKNDNAVVKRHIVDEEHREKRENIREMMKTKFQKFPSRFQCDWYRITVFCCDPCGKSFSSQYEFYQHLRSKSHEMSLKSSDISDREMIHDFCEKCSEFSYGFRSRHKSLSHNRNFSISELSELTIRLLRGMEKYVDDTMNYINGVELRETERDKTVVKDLEKLMKLKFNDVKAHLFGPREWRLGSANSKISIFLDCENMYDGNTLSKDQIINLMSTVTKLLNKNEESWILGKMSSDEETSIIKGRHQGTGLSFDITFENGLAVEMTEIIKYFNDKFPSCRRLIIFLNQWLIFCNVSGNEPISSYALEWCVIFYLQKKSKLPSVVKLFEKKKKFRIISECKVGLSDDFDYEASSITIKELSMGFFDFYANFDYRHDVACPLIGETIKKREFAVLENLPKEMQTYADILNDSDVSQAFPIDSVMCVQNPFDLRENLTKEIGKADLCRFRGFCAKSLKILRS